MCKGWEERAKRKDGLLPCLSFIQHWQVARTTLHTVATTGKVLSLSFQRLWGDVVAMHTLVWEKLGCKLQAPSPGTVCAPPEGFLCILVEEEAAATTCESAGSSRKGECKSNSSVVSSCSLGWLPCLDSHLQRRWTLVPSKARRRTGCLYSFLCVFVTLDQSAVYNVCIT